MNKILFLLSFSFYIANGQEYIIRQASKKNIEKKDANLYLKRSTALTQDKIVWVNKWHRIDKSDASSFWGDSSEINKPVQLSIGQGINGQIYTDLISSRIEKCKITFSSVLSNTTDSTANRINNFLNGGGNAILKAAFPLSTIQNNSTPDLINATFLFIPRIAANLPKLSKSEKLNDWNIDIGFELHGIAASIDGKLGVVGKVRGAIITGSDSFSSAFLKSGKTFAYLQFSGGILIKKDFIISVNIKPLITGKKAKDFNDIFFSNIGIQVML